MHWVVNWNYRCIGELIVACVYHLLQTLHNLYIILLLTSAFVGTWEQTVFCVWPVGYLYKYLYLIRSALVRILLPPAKFKTSIWLWVYRSSGQRDVALCHNNHSEIMIEIYDIFIQNMVIGSETGLIWVLVQNWMNKRCSKRVIILDELIFQH